MTDVKRQLAEAAAATLIEHVALAIVVTVQGGSASPEGAFVVDVSIRGGSLRSHSDQHARAEMQRLKAFGDIMGAAIKEAAIALKRSDEDQVLIWDDTTKPTKKPAGGN